MNGYLRNRRGNSQIEKKAAVCRNALQTSPDPLKAGNKPQQQQKQENAPKLFLASGEEGTSNRFSGLRRLPRGNEICGARNPS